LFEYFKNREATKKKLKISFSSLEEIEKIKQKVDFKLDFRNQLGVKSEEDWILNLNIGNVMNMDPMQIDEFNNNLIIDKSSKHISKITKKHSIYEKLVNLSSAYFCVGTEIRFLISKKI